MRLTALMLVAAVLFAQHPVKLIAHRGGVVDAAHPENSPGSLQAAIERNYWMVEVDIRENRDGRLVVQHDPDFQRFYGDPRLVAQMGWDEMRRLRATPGGSRPLEFHEFAELCRNKIQLMIDTKPPEHSKTFYAAMEKILRDNGLLAGAYFIGTPESQEYFRGKARIGVDRAKLEAALQRGENTQRLYFLFEHGCTLDEAGIELARRAGVPAVTSINIFHYEGMDHMKAARADIERLRRLGLTHFQIDSVYDSWLRR